MPARGALEIAKKLTLSLHGVLIRERFLQSQQESILLIPQHYALGVPVGEPPLYITNSIMESQSIRAA